METNQTINEKMCVKCHTVLPISNFHKSSKAKDGYQSYCKNCNNRLKSKKVKDTSTFQESKKLSEFTNRELIVELRRRGYRGEITYTHKIEL